MAEYIERETFLKDIEKRYCLPCKEAGKDHNGFICHACWVDAMRVDVIDAPAADIAPVVHCKDCKHRYSDSWCEYVDDDDNFYCARGERKDGDAAGGLASVAETRFVYCPNCGARMDGDSDG